MKKVLFTLPILILLLQACDTTLQRATGREDEIIVVADSSDYTELRTALEEVFEREIITPQPEQLYTLNNVSFESLETLKRWKNLIIVAPLESESITSRYLAMSLDSTALAQVREGGNGVIIKRDLWARNQMVMFLTAPTMQELEFQILKEADNLVYAFQKISDERLKRGIYNPRYELKDIEGKLLELYDWTIYVQADFTLAKNEPEDKFVWLRRGINTDVERWVFVSWKDNATPDFLEEENIRNWRNEVTEKYYRTSDDKYHVEISDFGWNTREVNFNDRYAIMVQGLWRMTDNFMGGPFVSYTFYDEVHQRVYMVDGSIFAPSYEKRNLIHQIDVLLQSFRARHELSEERVSDLEEAAQEF